MSQRRTPKQSDALQTPPHQAQKKSAGQSSGVSFAVLAAFAVILFVGAAVVMQRSNSNGTVFQTFGGDDKAPKAPKVDQTQVTDTSYQAPDQTKVPVDGEEQDVPKPTFGSSGGSSSGGKGKGGSSFPPIATGYPTLTQKQLTQLEKQLLSNIDDMEKTEFQQGDTVGALVRLGFHDSGTFSLVNRADPVGGPHACLAIECNNKACEFDAADNNGLQEIIRALKTWYNKDAYDKISLADYFILAANMAIYKASHGTFKPPFRYGRPDCAKFYDLSKFPNPGRPLFPGRLPAAVLDLAEIKRVFTDPLRLNLSPEEAVSLLGAHTIGRCENRFSGFDGRWLEQSSLWNNEYFVDVINHQWFPKYSGRNLPFYKTIFFELPDNYPIMLNTDISIYYEIFPNGGTAANSQDKRCIAVNPQDRYLFDQSKVSLCKTHDEANRGNQAFSAATRKFATSHSDWISVFRSAWKKLTEAGAPQFYQLYDPVKTDDKSVNLCTVSCGSSPDPCADVMDCDKKTGECSFQTAEQGRLTSTGRILIQCNGVKQIPTCHNTVLPNGPAACNPLLCCHQNEGCKHGTCVTSFRYAGKNCTEKGFDTIPPVEGGRCDGFGNCVKNGPKPDPKMDDILADVDELA